MELPIDTEYGRIRVIFVKHDLGQGYWCYLPDFAGVVTQGESITECTESIINLLDVYLTLRLHVEFGIKI